MKPSLSCVLLLVFITTTTHSITASAAQDFVRDSTGKKVLNDVAYHVGPVKGGRIKLANTTDNKKICPYDVVQEPSEANPGGLFQFTLIGSRETYLRKSRTFGIGSGYPKTGPCLKSTFWTIPDAEAKAPDNLITTGGIFDDGPTCFQIVEHPNPTNPKVPSYLLQNCPYFCGQPGPVKCYNVSFYEYKGVRRLASTGSTPFELVFYKVSN